jgi:hypothetical protein
MPVGKTKIFYFSLIILLGLIIYVGFQISTQFGDKPRGSVQRHIAFGEDNIFDFIYLNNEGEDVTYSYFFFIDGELYSNNTLLVPSGTLFQYVFNVGMEEKIDNVTFILYRQDSLEPIENTTFYVGMYPDTKDISG